jgi:DNA-binding CsgD family transcriptional regulator/tetratricopeptide (TPR) repeat protein
MKSLAVIGHELELVALNEFLASQGKLPAGLVFVGEAGIGKTTLWRHGLAAAGGAGYQIMATQATASESELGFAVLAALLQDNAAELLPELSLPQRWALEVAVLLVAPGPEAPQPRAIAMAFLAVLRLAARHRPLLVAIDDEQWIDAASSAALEFAIRRVKDERIGFLLTRRSDHDEEATVSLDHAFSPEQLTRVRVGPMSPRAIHDLLRSRLDVTFAPPTLRRLAETSAGNPFFALELARTIATHGSDLEMDEPLPLPKTLHAILTDRLRALPRSVQDALLIASLASDPSVALIARTLPGDGWRRVRPAVEAEVIELEGERIRFAHPLLASVAQASADLGRRRYAHKLLANVVLDPEERAVHLSLATDRPSEAVASALEQAAMRARARGASDSAANLAERAARLTTAQRPLDTRRRVLLAVDSHFDAGSLGRAERMLERLLEMSPHGKLRAEALARLASVRIQTNGPAAAIRDAQAALNEAADDVAIMAAVERTLTWAYHNAAHLTEACVHARTAVELAERVGDSAHLANALADLALMDFVAGKGFVPALIDRAIQLEYAPLANLTSVRWIQALLLEWTGENRRARSVLENLRAESGQRGQDVEVPFAMNWLARLALRAGDWARAKRLAEDTLEQTLQMSLEDEQTYAFSTAALVEAHFGHVDAARELTRRGLALAERIGTEPARFELLATRGFLELSLGDVAAACAVLASLAKAATVAGFDEPVILRFDPDYIEALIGLGRLAEAASVLGRLEVRATAFPNPWTVMAVARSRGLLEGARSDFSTALTTLEAAERAAADLGEPFELARTQVALATVQRRSKQWADARRLFLQALQTFERLGALLWVTRAQEELSRVPGRKPAGKTLTPTERRVAELVAEGRSNKEVATALFVTVKAVEANLSRVYEKLAVRSRSELAHRFAREPEPKL